MEPQTTARIYSKDRKNWHKKRKVLSKSSPPRSYKVLNENHNVVLYMFVSAPALSGFVAMTSFYLS